MSERVLATSVTKPIGALLHDADLLVPRVCPYRDQACGPTYRASALLSPVRR